MSVETLEQNPSEQAPDIPPPRTDAERLEDQQRRAQIVPMSFSHSAMRINDLRKTRHFYEDVIGLPMVRADRVRRGPEEGRGPPYDMIHAFFELADGSLIAFFEADQKVCDPNHVFPRNPLQLHFAVRMPTEQSVRDAEGRLREAGYGFDYIPHHDGLSLYIDDPDGLQLELVYHYDNFDDSLGVERAHKALDDWYAGGQRWA